ncbi:MAG TPA: hypothetical protein VHM69_16180 [Rubrobacter sp.]|nr:hypothetical protein [Rubrobacter sp.]
MRIAGYFVTGLGVVFIALGIVDYVLKEIAPPPEGPPQPSEPTGLTAFILALARLTIALTGAPTYVSATILGVLLVVLGVTLVTLAQRRPLI